MGREATAWQRARRTRSRLVNAVHSTQDEITARAPGASGVWYTLAGYELVVLRLGAGNASEVLRRVDLRALDVFEGQGPDRAVTLDAFGDGDPRDVPVGVRQTFSATRLVQPPEQPGLLVVLGSAVDAIGGVSPLIVAQDAPVDVAPPPVGADAPDLAGWMSDSLRPFRAAVAIVFDITAPPAPVARSVAMVEGELARAHAAGASLWLVVRAAPHVSYEVAAAGAAPRAMDDSVMPIHRFWFGVPAGLVPWQRVSRCTDVQYFTTFGGTTSPTQSRLTSVLRMRVSGAEPGRLAVGTSLSMALAWDRVCMSALHSVVSFLDAILPDVCQSPCLFDSFHGDVASGRFAHRLAPAWQCAARGLAGPNSASIIHPLCACRCKASISLATSLCWPRMLSGRPGASSKRRRRSQARCQRRPPRSRASTFRALA